ncbi:hypothetical protein [Sphingopyxis sp. MWB1]|uniref:hypothetical protein n=1 Tax=Sphingopyxis sp. MWB1 TaxID=1537715 RepID=UPI00051A7166|nr:hypothetical protein [Sphingopyxis sp. MWB1]
MERSLLQRIEAFLKESGMPPTLFGRAAVRDPRLVSDLRRGREPGRRVITRTENYMNHWRAERDAGRVQPAPPRAVQPGRPAGNGPREQKA